MDVGAVVTAVKGAIATVGKLREITKAMDQVELKSAIADLANQLVDAQFKVAELKDELAALQAENKALKAKQSEEKPTILWGCYKFGDEQGLYCPACYDTKGKKHLTTRTNMNSRSCSVCKAVLGS